MAEERKGRYLIWLVEKNEYALHYANTCYIDERKEDFFLNDIQNHIDAILCNISIKAQEGWNLPLDVRQINNLPKYNYTQQSISFCYSRC